MKPRPTYANVMATVAVFIALGGSAYASFRIPPHSVGSRQLKAAAVGTGKLANEAITPAKIAEHSITATQIDLPGLGTVPSADRAESAGESQSLNGHSASCPGSTVLIRGLCFDSQTNPEAPNLEAAAEDCAAKGGYLPTPMELYATKGVLSLGSGVGPSQHQFTDVLYSAPGTNNGFTTIVVNGSGLPTEQPAGAASAFYCVYSLLR